MGLEQLHAYEYHYIPHPATEMIGTPDISGPAGSSYGEEGGRACNGHIHPSSLTLFADLAKIH